MESARWAQIEELFHQVVECDPNRRAALLDEACNSDSELRREVETLLSHEASAHDHVQAAVHSEVVPFGSSLEGQIVSHYRVLQALGSGGMGLVYEAEDTKLGRRVALKFLPDESAKDPAALARFEREARAASALEHPNICPIYEFGEHQGQPFLVMQLLEGKTLRELLQERRLSAPQSNSDAAKHRTALPLEQTLDLTIQISAGLNAAHRRGIVHRDVKPANIFVSSNGEIKILDFGLAKLTLSGVDALDPTGHDRHTRNREGGDASATLDPLLSRTGATMGTVGYMSPEQARGEKLDARTDVFSFGLVLYEMTTGHRAFEGDTGLALHEAILTKPAIPARRLNPDVPVRLESLINRALEKDREKRYQNVSDIRTELEAIKADLAPKNLSRRWTLSVGVSATMLIAVALFWYARRAALSPQPLPDVKLTQLTANAAENQVTGGNISPDGKLLAYTDGQGVHVRTIGTDELRSLALPKTEANLVWQTIAWFPDNDRFLVNGHAVSENTTEWSSLGSSVWVFSARGAPPRKLRDDAVGSSVSPAGELIAFGTNKKTVLGDSELWMMSPNGERARKVYQSDAGVGVCCLTFFPDGERAGYIVQADTGDFAMSLYLKGGPPSVWVPAADWKRMGDGTFLPDGSWLYADQCGKAERADTPCSFWMERRDPRTGKLIEAPRKITTLVGFSTFGPTSSVNGKRVAFLRMSNRNASYIAHLEAASTRVSNAKRVTLEELGEDTVINWAADSKTLILIHNRAEHYTLLKQAINSDTAEPITPREEGLLENAIVSPDQKWVLFQVFPAPAEDTIRTIVKVMRVPISGGTPELIFSMHNGGSISCAKPPSKMCVVAEESPDRKTMIVTSFDPIRGRGDELMRLDLGPYTKNGVSLGTSALLFDVSPDGTRLAIARGSSAPIEIFSLRGQHLSVTPKIGNMWPLFWAADGRGLFVAKHLYDGTELLHVGLNGRIHSLWKSHGESCYGVPSPDGRRIAIFDSQVTANMWMMENF